MTTTLTVRSEAELTSQQASAIAAPLTALGYRVSVADGYLERTYPADRHDRPAGTYREQGDGMTGHRIFLTGDQVAAIRSWLGGA